MPPAYVKPHVKRNKSDAIDAAACCKAVADSDMRLVPVKTVNQQAALALHRTRDLLVRERTRVINALRALLAEFGIVAGKGKAGVVHLVERLRAGTLELPAEAVFAATVLADQHDTLKMADEALKRRITAQAKADKTTRMLQTVPGVGPLIAHATRATLPDPSRFKSGRDFAAFLGLTPSNNGTGGKSWTGHITKKGNHGLRRLLVQGATSWVRHVSHRLDKASPWLRGMLARKAKKVVAVALAARNARILWAMLTHNQPYRAPAVG
jgi:transposase